MVTVNKNFGMASLRLHMEVLRHRVNPLSLAAVLLIAAGVFAVSYLLAERSRARIEHRAVLSQIVEPKPTVHQSIQPDLNNLLAFRAALGEQRYAEQQIRALFGLAEKAGLTLREGDYRESYNKHAGVYLYQVALPVEGPYGAVWQFAMMSLATIPFASLDDISFRRNGVTDSNVEARLRLTLYLSGGAP